MKPASLPELLDYLAAHPLVTVTAPVPWRLEPWAFVRRDARGLIFHPGDLGPGEDFLVPFDGEGSLVFDADGFDLVGADGRRYRFDYR